MRINCLGPHWIALQIRPFDGASLQKLPFPNDHLHLAGATIRLAWPHQLHEHTLPEVQRSDLKVRVEIGVPEKEQHTHTHH